MVETQFSIAICVDLLGFTEYFTKDFMNFCANFLRRYYTD